MQQWEELTTVKEVQSFLRFENFYRQFIKGYSKLTKPSTDMTKKHEKFVWIAEFQRALDELKKRFTTSPILRHFDPELPCIVECNASDFAIGAILSLEIDGLLNPIAFHSRKMNKHESNYEIHDKELLAITSAFKEWRRYLKGAGHKINVYTNHKGLEWFANNRPLNRRQARWALELDGFDFVIIYRPGVKNGKLDALSRRSEFRREKGGQGNQPIERVLEEGQWVPKSYRESYPESYQESYPDSYRGSYRESYCGNLNIGSEVMLSSVQIQELCPVVRITKVLEGEIVEKAANDPTWQELYNKVKKNGAIEGDTLADITYKYGILFRKSKIWIPNDSAYKLRKLISENEHDTIVAGNMGIDKTL